MRGCRIELQHFSGWQVSPQLKMFGWKLVSLLEVVNQKLLFLPLSSFSLTAFCPWRTAASSAFFFFVFSELTMLRSLRCFVFSYPRSFQVIETVLSVTPVRRICVYMAILILPCSHHTQMETTSYYVWVIFPSTHLLILLAPSKIIYPMKLLKGHCVVRFPRSSLIQCV